MRLAPTHFINLSWSSLLYPEMAKPVPAREEQMSARLLSLHNVQHFARRCAKRAGQHGSKVTGSLTGTASMDHSPSPINLLFSVLIKAILDAGA
jgi:hypothetical protein